MSNSTARLTSPAGTVSISWSSGTVVVDAVSAKATDITVGSCVLVLPPAGGSAPTATSVAAGLIRVVPSSPSCPVLASASPTAGKAPKVDHEGGGSITVAPGQGVIGTVTAVSRKALTLTSLDQGRARTVTVSVSPLTQYRKAGDHPLAGITVGRCATVWGTVRNGSHLAATRMQVSDPVGGRCGDAALK